MKKLLLAFITLTILISCSSSSKHLVSGNYDAALQKSAKKIRKNPDKFDEVDTFNDAYRMAYNKDNAEVNRLKQLNNPANWSKIYSIYVRMNKRQDLAASLPPVGISYEQRDFHSEIATAKTNATEYAYNKGVELLATYDRDDARLAYNKFKEAQGFNADYKDVRAKLKEAKMNGTTNIFFRVEDNTTTTAPENLLVSIQRMNVNDLDKNWKNYDSYADTNKYYHYSVILKIYTIEISPEELKEAASIETKEVKDGFDYILDAKGNVTKDSLGNDIKVPRYKTISCTITRFKQKKTAKITGENLLPRNF